MIKLEFNTLKWLQSSAIYVSHDMIISKRWHHRARGFKLKTVRRRLCVQWHRVNNFISFFYKLKYWKFPYVDRVVNLLNKGGRLGIRSSNCNNRNRNKASSRNSLNSFYSDAISDCLEFIKLSADHSGNEHKLNCEELQFVTILI